MKKVVFIIEDDEHVARAIGRMLHGLADVLTFSTAERFARFCGATRWRIDDTDLIVISDYELGRGGNGDYVLWLARALWPGSRRVLHSGKLGAFSEHASAIVHKASPGAVLVAAALGSEDAA